MDNDKETKTPFEITDDKTANWAFKKLAEVQKQLKEKDDELAGYKKQNQEWYERVTRPLKKSEDIFEQLIEQYRQTKLDKKVDVPAGRTEVRHTKDFQKDIDKLVPYLKTNFPEFIKEEPKWGDFKKKLKVHGEIAIDPNGEEVPGIHVAVKESVLYKPNKLGDEL